MKQFCAYRLCRHGIYGICMKFLNVCLLIVDRFCVSCAAHSKFSDVAKLLLIQLFFMASRFKVNKEGFPLPLSILLSNQVFVIEHTLDKLSHLCIIKCRYAIDFFHNLHFYISYINIILNIKKISIRYAKEFSKPY